MWRNRFAVVGVIGAGVLLSSCGGAPTARHAGSTAIPWSDSTPAPPSLPTPSPIPVVPAGTPNCRAQDVRVVFAAGNALTGGQLVAHLALGNQSDTSCVLEGVPGLQLLDASGKLIPGTNGSYRRLPEQPVLLAPNLGATEGQLVPGQAWFEIYWRTHDGAGSCANPSPLATAARLQLPAGGGELMVSLTNPRLGGIAPCGGGVGIGPFQPVTPPPPPYLPPPHQFTPEVRLPAKVKAGELLRYEVTLRNVTAEPVRFGENCPAYREDLYPEQALTAPPPPGKYERDEPATRGKPPLGKHRYLLNCRPAGSIAPGAEVTFAMVLGVPASAEPGRYFLLWALDEGVSSNGIQRVPIAIVR
jgi:hypothetical protein